MNSTVARSRRRRLRTLLRHSSGIAFVEFAYTLPMITVLMLAGVELSNYVTTKMRLSQQALLIADSAARIGTGSQLAAKQISERQINDVLMGANLQSGKLGLATNGRVILSSLEPDPANSSPSNKRYRIRWQRCMGAKNRASTYGNTGANNLTGMGPAGQQIIAPEDGATMFVEVYYRYRPLITSRFSVDLDMVEIASMPVRDRRDTTTIYNPEGVDQNLCTELDANPND